MSNLKTHDDLKETLGLTFNLKLLNEDQEINEKDLLTLLKKGKYSNLDFEDYQFDDSAKINFTQVKFTFPKKAPFRKFPVSDEPNVVDPNRPYSTNPDDGDKMEPEINREPPTTLVKVEEGPENTPKGAKCSDLDWEFPESETININTKNLKKGKRVYVINKPYSFTYDNCKEELEWKLNKKSKGKGVFNYTFRKSGLYEICLEGKGCDSVLVSYSLEKIHQKFRIILDAPIGKDISGDVRKLASMMSCLLYTSPSPRDRTRSRMPSSA